MQPTNELDGPRGWIYLIKQMLDGHPVSARTRLHLDRCLSCRSCETTCPSGVEYSKLLNLGRGEIETIQPRPLSQQLLRYGMKSVLPYPKRLQVLLKIAQLSAQLRDNKLANLSEQQPDIIATGNIGCMLHLEETSPLPVLHWIEIVEEFGAESQT